MQRFIFTMIVLLQCLFASASASVLVLDLDNEINADILSSSEFYLENDRNADSNFASIAKLPNSSWRSFGRDQLRFGFTDKPVWLRTSLKTTGSQPKKVVLALHKVLNNITMKVNREGFGSQLYTFSKNLGDGSKVASNVNNTTVYLEPNQSYQRGYLQKWTELSQLGTIQRISAIFLITAILSLVAFFRALSTDRKREGQFKRLYQILFLAGYTLIPVMFLLPFQQVLHLIIILIVMSISVGIARALLNWKEKEKQTSEQTESFSLSLTLLIVLVTLVPSVMLHILSRRGIVDVLWYTEFVLFASIILEVTLISAVLFFNIRQNKEAYERELHTNNLTGLPNGRALEKNYYQEDSASSKTMIQVWISGLDELHIAFGPEVYQEFQRDTARQMNLGLKDVPEVIKYQDENRNVTSLYHCDKNTFTILCWRADKAARNAIIEQLNNALDTMTHLHHINLDLKLVMGAYEFDHNKSGLNTTLVNCNLALAHSIKHNQRFKFYTPQMSFDEHQRLVLVNDFQVYHCWNNQTVSVSSLTGSSMKFCAVCRWCTKAIPALRYPSTCHRAI